MSSPREYLETCFIHDERGRMAGTREPEPAPGALFCIARGVATCAWSVHADLPEDAAGALKNLAMSEPGNSDFRQPPAHADEYRAILREYLSSRHEANIEPLEQRGPAMTFPRDLPPAGDIVRIEDERLLAIEFHNWTIGEIAGGRAPVLAAIEDGHPVSVCFCARSSTGYAEAGVETAPRYRGRGFAPRVTAAWAHAIRAQGRTPLYSTQWTNVASLAVARKLGLLTYASVWSLAKPQALE